MLSGTKSSMLILALYSNYITGFSAGCYFKYSLLYFCGVIQNTIINSKKIIQFLIINNAELTKDKIPIKEGTLLNL